MQYIVIDTETTGLTRKYSALTAPCSLRENGDEVVQLGGIVLDEDLQPRRAFCHYCDCMLPEMPEKAYNVNGICISDIRRSLEHVYLEEVVAHWVPELLIDNVTLIGYNTEFDVRMMEQSMRNFYGGFKKYRKVASSLLVSTGNWFIDVMDYLPKRVKLAALHGQCVNARDTFYRVCGGKLPLETNLPELLEPTIQQAHNSLYDAIETYAAFKTLVFGKKLFKAGEV